MPSFRNEDHMINRHKSINPSHAYPRVTSPSRPKSQKLADLITKFESLDLKGKAFSQPEIKPSPLQLPRRGEYIKREKQRLVAGNRDMDMDMEMQMRDVDTGELEKFAREMDRLDTMSAEKAAQPGEQSWMVARNHLGNSGHPRRHLDENFAIHAGNKYKTVQNQDINLHKRLSLPTDLSSVRHIPEIPTSPRRRTNFNNGGGLRRESTIVDRIRLFDGSVEDTNKTPPKSAIKTPLNTSSSGPNQRVISAERRSTQYTPSSVRNSYVQGRSATKTPTKSASKAALMWTPASKDLRSRKKELYTQSYSPRRTREQAQSSTITASNPLRANPPTVEQLHSQHQLIQAWADQSTPSHRDQNSKTPTPAFKGPGDYFALESPKTPERVNRSARSERIRKATSRVDIREKIGKAIAARVDSIRNMDPAFMSALNEGIGEADRDPLIQEEKGPLPSASLMESAINKPFLDKDMEVSPLKIKAQKVEPKTQCCENGLSPSRKVSRAVEEKQDECCANGSSPSRKVSREVHQKHGGGDRDSDSENEFPAGRRVSKLANRISMFEKVFGDSPRKAKTMPVGTQVEQPPQGVPSQARDKVETKAATPPVNTFQTPRNPFSDPHRTAFSESISSQDEDEALLASVMRDRKRTKEIDADEVPLINMDIQPMVSPTMQGQEEDDLFKSPPKFNTTRVTMINTDTQPMVSPTMQAQAEDDLFRNPPKFNTTRVTEPHSVVQIPATPPKPPVKVKTGGSLLDRIKIWETRSALADKDKTPTVKNESPPKNRRHSNSQCWIKPSPGTGIAKRKTLNGKEIADVVADLGREMNVSVVSRDIAKTREVWAEKEIREKESASATRKPLTRVYSKYYEVPPPSQRELRRSTVHGGSETRERSGPSAIQSFDTGKVPAEGSIDSGHGRDGTLSVQHSGIPMPRFVPTPLRLVLTSPKDTFSSLHVEAESEDVSENMSTEEEKKHIDFETAHASRINELIDSSIHRKDANASRESEFYRTDSFTERFMKGLRDGKPETVTRDIEETPASGKIKSKDMDSRLPMGRLRYPKMYNMQAGNFVQKQGENSHEEAVFAFSPMESLESSDKSTELENGEAIRDILRESENNNAGHVEKSRWSYTGSSAASRRSSRSDDGRDVSFARESGQTWLGPRSKTSSEAEKRSRATSGSTDSWWSDKAGNKSAGVETEIRMALRSPDAIEIGESSPEPAQNGLGHEYEDTTICDTIHEPLPLSTTKADAQVKELRNRETSSQGSGSSFSKQEAGDGDEATTTNEDDDEFDVVEDLKGIPVLLGKRIQSGMLKQPQPQRAAEKERLVLLCNRDSWSSSVVRRREGGSAS